MKILDGVKDYLEYIKIEKNYKREKINCEICSSDEHTLIREISSVGNDNYFAKLPVVACNQCGFLFQNPRFPEEFYKYFYSKNYSAVLHGNTTPLKKNLVDDQLLRSDYLFKSIKDMLPDRGNILDVGSAAGGMMKAFLNNGWDGLGIDPDVVYVEYGKNVLKLPVEVQDAENMDLQPNFYDLTIIMGSLEHIYDPNKTLRACYEAGKENSFLLLEGRGPPQKHSRIYFNHNHHRYFTLNSIQLMMIKHGWKPVLTTGEALTGPIESRKGTIFCLGVKTEKKSNSEFVSYIEHNKENISDILLQFEELDKKWS